MATTEGWQAGKLSSSASEFPALARKMISSLRCRSTISMASPIPPLSVRETPNGVRIMSAKPGWPAQSMAYMSACVSDVEPKVAARMLCFNINPNPREHIWLLFKYAARHKTKRSFYAPFECFLGCSLAPWCPEQPVQREARRQVRTP